MKTQEPTYKLLLEAIEQKLRQGQLQVGDRLPGERTLAEEYGISRASVREALRILSAVGLIRSGVGSGPRSGAVVVSEPSDALGWALRMHIATRTLPVQDLVATRILLEGQAAADAAASPAGPRKEAALAQARQILDEMDQPAITNDRFHFCDTRFHYIISSLASNLVLETVIDSLHLATISYVAEIVPRLDSWDQTKAILQQQHRAIVEAVERGDSQAAREAVAEHISWFYQLSTSAQPSLPERF